FWGSQYFDADIIVAARRAALDRARALITRFDLELEFVSIGGGIAMRWCATDPEVDWKALEAAGAEPVRWGDSGSATLACEYGRAIVGPAGSLLTTVLDTKTVGDRRYILVDAGMNQVLIASRLVAGAGRGEPAVRVVNPTRPDVTSGAYVTGPLCSQLDVLAED